MNTSKLEYLIEIAKTNSLSKAAENLFVTQSALSQVVKQFEEEYKIKIFHRNKKGAFLTKEGKEILHKSIEVIDKVNELEILKQSFQTYQREIKIAAIPGLMHELVTNVSAFKNKYPYIKVYIEEKGTDDIIQALRNQEVDLGLASVYEEDKSEIDGLVFEPIYSGEMSVCVSPYSSLALKDSCTINDLLNEPIALYSDVHAEYLVEQISNKVGPLNILFKSNNSDAIRQSILIGEAITLGHNFSFNRDPYVLNSKLKILKIQDFEISSAQFGWLRAKNNVSSKFIKDFISKCSFKFE